MSEAEPVSDAPFSLAQYYLAVQHIVKLLAAVLTSILREENGNSFAIARRSCRD